MKSFQEALEAYASSGERGDLPDFPVFIQGLEVHFATWHSSLQQMPEEMRQQLVEAEERVGQGYIDCLQGATDLSQTPAPELAVAFLRLHRQHTQNLYLFQEEVWRHHGPTPLSGINQVFWAYESWMGGGSPQEYYWHCIEAERKRLSYAIDTPGMEAELLACAGSLRDGLEQLLRLGGGPESESQLDEIQRLAHRYAELLGPEMPANWLAHLELLLGSEDDQELHSFVWRKLAELHSLGEGVRVLLQSMDSALLEEKGKELQGLFEELATALQDLLEDPEMTLDEVREIDADLSAARQDVLILLDLQGQLACPKCAATVEKSIRFCPGCGFRMLDRIEEREKYELSESAPTVSRNPNLAYLQSVSQEYADGKVDGPAMLAELARWQRLLAELPNEESLRSQVQELNLGLERMQAWVDQPSLASLSHILEGMEKALSEVAQAQPGAEVK